MIYAMNMCIHVHVRANDDATKLDVHTPFTGVEDFHITFHIHKHDV